MKYIITYNEDTGETTCYEPQDKESYLWLIKHEKLIKEANTIKDLCDEFIRVREDIHYYLSSNDVPTLIKGWEIYGGVWTKQGLQFIAQLNEKGEFELI